jgi:Nuclease-related domain
MLAKLSDDFCVINDLATSNGNIDHVVVGPTGVFILDTKSWRGVVEADGKGELLLNGKPTEKRFIHQFVGRMMGVREKVIMLAPRTDARFNAMFVFTAARVEARWGKTGHLNCLTDEQLCNYIRERDFGKKLRPDEVSQIAQAFLGLALMDQDFGRASRTQAQAGRSALQLVGAD